MRSLWVFTTQTTKVWIVTGVASVLLLCNANAEVEVRSEPQQVVYDIREIDAPSVIVDEALQQSVRFRDLMTKWRSERRATSSITAMAMCDAYQRMIGMGPSVIPFIIAQLRSEGEEPDQWFWALQVLSEIDPVSEEDRGDFTKMAAAWISWAENEYVR